MKKTKIICTLGPATDEEAVLTEMMHSGMDIARLNFSHGTKEEQQQRIRRIQRLRRKQNRPIGILLDTKGPEIRTGKMANDRISLTEKQEITIVTNEVLGTPEKISVNYAPLPDEVHAGDTILMDDGLLKLCVTEIRGQEIHALVVNGGELGSKKGVNIPGVKVNLPPITQRDEEDIRFGLAEGIDFIAASFVRNKEAIERIRTICKEMEKEVCIIAKIENEEGVKNIDEIIDAADGIMIARGDLGVEIPPEEVPFLQKMILKKCNYKMKPAITATQMLDSMIRHPRPTRAEAADVANAIYDGTDAIMLSGESAAGKYPVESVRMMVRIAEETEQHLEGAFVLSEREMKSRVTISSTVAHMSVQAAEELKASCIIAATMSGTTARYLSKFRPPCLIVGVTPHEEIMRRMQLYWGVYPVKNQNISTTDELIFSSIDMTRRTQVLKKGDVCVMTAGIAPKEKSPYTTNMIRAFRLEE